MATEISARLRKNSSVSCFPRKTINRLGLALLLFHDFFFALYQFFEYLNIIIIISKSARAETLPLYNNCSTVLLLFLGQVTEYFPCLPIRLKPSCIYYTHALQPSVFLGSENDAIQTSVFHVYLRHYGDKRGIRSNESRKYCVDCVCVVALCCYLFNLLAITIELDLPVCQWHV